MDDIAKKAEIDAFFKQEMEQSKKVWEMRGKDARIKAHTARMANPTWRNLKGMEFLLHEANHIGNKPFVTGLLIVAGACFYAQTTFTDEMKANSEYWQTFHAKGGDKHH